MTKPTKQLLREFSIGLVFVVLLLALFVSCARSCSKPADHAQAKLAEKMAMIMIGSNPRFTVTELNTPTNRLMYLIKDSETKLEFIYISDTGVVVLPQK